jgi:hypothetical protein
MMEITSSAWNNDVRQIVEEDMPAYQTDDPDCRSRTVVDFAELISFLTKAGLAPAEAKQVAARDSSAGP